MVEEFDEAGARAPLEVTFFGALRVCQAALPHLRERRGGQLLQMSSTVTLGSFPSAGMSSASEFALTGMGEALAAEAVLKLVASDDPPPT